ncbi:putative secreted protein [Mycobacterium liflandii 128FXT]|uniref:Secreted protein n=2 Tax=Mycobacterium ulcerans group TaxID=2993898 RepID=L7VE30_MYCL1|nr:putative secreted protein [Mycobacterium liflandii 128FXT]
MMLKLSRLGAAILGGVAALMFSTAVATAGPPDPHQPDMTKGYCPGGRWGWGELAVCDGEKYPDGSFWHQWMRTYMTGPQFYYDCVGGDEPLPGPPPPVAATELFHPRMLRRLRMLPHPQTDRDDQPVHLAFCKVNWLTSM